MDGLTDFRATVRVYAAIGVLAFGLGYGAGRLLARWHRPATPMAVRVVDPAATTGIASGSAVGVQAVQLCWDGTSWRACAPCDARPIDSRP